MNKKAVIEWQYLPPVQYFTKWLLYEEVLLENWENYRKGTFRNRTYIAAANGPLRLTIPLRKGKNEQQPISEVRIAFDQPWPQQHWSSIQSAYGNAPFFPYYANDLEAAFRQPPSRLIDWNRVLLQIILPALNLPDEIRQTDRWQDHLPPEVDDLRNHLHPKPQHRKPDPRFQPQPYAQVFMEKHGFLPNLSILDLLFCAGPESLFILEASSLRG